MHLVAFEVRLDPALAEEVARANPDQPPKMAGTPLPVVFRSHAVAVVEGTPARVTMCGRSTARLHIEPDDTFEEQESGRCPDCDEAVFRGEIRVSRSEV